MKVILSIEMFLGLVLLTACGVNLDEIAQQINSANAEGEFSQYYNGLELNSEEEVNGEMATDESIFALLSEDAQEVHDDVREYLKILKDEERLICSRDYELHDTIRSELDAILANASLTDEEKHSAALAVMETPDIKYLHASSIAWLPTAAPSQPT